MELGAAFSNPDDRADFLLVDKMVRTRPDVTLIPASTGLLQRGRDLFAARADKAWSLTDCTSFVVMEELGLAGRAHDRSSFHAGRIPCVVGGRAVRVCLTRRLFSP